MRLHSASELFPFVSYDLRLLARKSCLKSERPPVNGIASTFFSNARRRSIFASISSSCAPFGATTAPMYFTKLIPHFSHFTPMRCLFPQEGHSKCIVMWHRWQKRATSRTVAPHLGQGSVACGAGVAVGSHVPAGFVAGNDGFDARGVSDFALDTSPLTGPEDEPLVIAHFSWAAAQRPAPNGFVRRQGYPCSRVQAGARIAVATGRSTIKRGTNRRGRSSAPNFPRQFDRGY
jgi:hypothetical protein